MLIRRYPPTQVQKQVCWEKKKMEGNNKMHDMKDRSKSLFPTNIALYWYGNNIVYWYAHVLSLSLKECITPQMWVPSWPLLQTWYHPDLYYKLDTILTCYRYYRIKMQTFHLIPATLGTHVWAGSCTRYHVAVEYILHTTWWVKWEKEELATALI